MLLASLLVPSAFANPDIGVQYLSSSNDFIFQAFQEDFDLCSCQQATQTLYLKNTDVFSTKITLSSNLDYVSFSQSQVVLEPNQEAVVTATIAVPCDVKRSDNLIIQASSTANVKKYIEQSVDIEKCHNVRIALYEDTLNASLCEPFTTTIRVENSGVHDEVYSIDVMPFGDYVSLSEQDVLIPAQGFVDIDVLVNLPCDVYGVQQLTYLVTAKQTGSAAKVVQTINLPATYDFSLLGPEALSLCPDKEFTTELYVTNEESFPQELELSVRSPLFVKVIYPLVDGKESRTVLLQPNETVAVTLHSQAKEMHKGDHSVTFTASSSIDGSSREISLPLIVENCYDVQTSLYVGQKKYVCGGDAFDIPFAIHNKGVKPVNLVLDIQGTDMLSFENHTITVDADYWLDYPIKGLISTDEQSSYPVTVSVFQDDELVNSHSFKLVVNTLKACHKFDVQKDELSVRFDKDSFDVPVKNKGTRYGTYELSLVNEPYFLELDKDVVSAGSTQKKAVPVLIDPLAVELYLMQNNLTSLLGQSFTFTLEALHEDSQIVYAHNLTLQFKDYSWFSKLWSTIYYMNVCTLLFIVLGVLALLFFILFLARIGSNWRFSMRWSLAIVLVIILLLAVAGVFIVYGVPSKADMYTQHDLSQSTSTHFFLAEDQKASFALDEYFVDPDDDIVLYGVQTIDENVLSYNLDGSQLTLIPQDDWYGTTWLYVFATDSYNETAVSEPILVEVLPVEDYTPQQCFAFFCGYINLVVLFFFFLFLVLTFSLRRKHKAQIPPGKKNVQKKPARKQAKKSAKKK